MTLNCGELGCAVTFMKYLASVVSLIFLLENWNNFLEGCQFDSPFIFQEELIKYHYNDYQTTYLKQVESKNCDIICYMLTLVV